VRVEAVDSNGLLPLRAADRVHLTAYSFRRFLQRELPNHLGASPNAEPLVEFGGPRATIRPEILKRWPMASEELLAGSAEALETLPIDGSVPVVPGVRGGESAARTRLEVFLDRRFDRYATDRNEVDDEVVSELSPYLHLGMISSHEIFVVITERERWTPLRLAGTASGSREGWWGMSASAEAFLDQLITWREVGFNRAWQCDDNQQYESLPDWARATLDQHALDPHPFIYSFEQLEAAQTHDEIWNAAQTQLVREGRIHNYLRMLWGKKILEWSATPREALAAMIALNDKYALDGRDPNSYSGIFWCLGRYDRPWGPIRPIFGSIRYMSSDNTRRKLSLAKYLARYSPAAQRNLF
jgi:deoxyribodipyrimidine photo-lyase